MGSGGIGSLFGPLGTQIGLGKDVLSGGGAITRAAYDYRGNLVSGELDLKGQYGGGDLVDYTDKAGKKQSAKASDFITNILPELQAVGKAEDEAAAKQQEALNQQTAINQQDTALKTVSKKKPKPKGGTILTSPLGLLGNSNSNAKTLIGA